MMMQIGILKCSMKSKWCTWIMVYLDTRVRLQQRLNGFQREIHDDVQSDVESISEDEIPPGQGEPNNGRRQEHEQQNDRQEIPQNVPMVQNQQGPAQYQFPMPPIHVQCQSENRHRKIENTWGEFDGTLSKWQGFHDRFKAEVKTNLFRRQ